MAKSRVVSATWVQRCAPGGCFDAAWSYSVIGTYIIYIWLNFLMAYDGYSKTPKLCITINDRTGTAIYSTYIFIINARCIAIGPNIYIYYIYRNLYK